MKKEIQDLECQVALKQKLLNTQRREVDLQTKLCATLDKNEQLQQFFENYQSEKEVKLIKQMEQIKKQNSSQINSLSFNYEEQVKTFKEIIIQLQEHIGRQKEIIEELESEKQQLNLEQNMSNAKVNCNDFTQILELLTICENLQEQEKIYEETKQELIQCEKNKVLIEKNYKLEIQALQIQLQEASKFIDSSQILQEKLNLKEIKLQELLYQNNQLNDVNLKLKQQINSIEQHFQLNVEEQRKANIILSKREFELQSILESQAQNFIEQEQKLKYQYDVLYNDFQNLRIAYTNLKLKNGDNALRLKLYQTSERKENRSATQSQPRFNKFNPQETDYQSNIETIKINDEGFIRALEDFKNCNQTAKGSVKRLDRNVYVKGN